VEHFKENGGRKEVAEYDSPAPCIYGRVSFPDPDAHCLAPALYGFCVALDVVCLGS
jgi:hypothetical protein